MTKKEAVQRWNNPDFVASLDPPLAQVFAEGAPIRNIHFEGIVIGAQSPVKLFFVGLHQREIARSEFSFSTFECAFSGSTITETSFRSCAFESSSFQKSKLLKCSFSGATFKGGGCNDSLFEECDFTRAKLSDKSTLPLSFLRARFFRCDFTDAIINGAEFRAAVFEECNFAGSRFMNCDLRGAKFLGVEPDTLQFGKGCSM